MSSSDASLDVYILFMVLLYFYQSMAGLFFFSLVDSIFDKLSSLSIGTKN